MPTSTPPEEQGVPDHTIGRSRDGLSPIIHAVVDWAELPVQLMLSPGQASDMTAAPEHLGDLAAS